MDANGTKFSLVQGEDDWARCRGVQNDDSLSAPGKFEEANGLSYDQQRSELTLFPQLFVFCRLADRRAVGTQQRRGAALESIRELVLDYAGPVGFGGLE